MKTAHVFPTLMILASLGSAIVYAGEFDWRRSIYWLAAAAITASVTF